jgi:hypothetical protein
MIWPMRLALGLALVLGACTTAPSTQVTPAPAHRPSASAPARPLTAATASAAPSPALPGPVGALLGGVLADFDCDRTLDKLEFFEASPSGLAGTGKVARLTLAPARTFDLAFEGSPSADGPENPLIGVADVNGDGCADAIVTVGHGASTTLTAFITFAGGRLVQAQEDGRPAIFLFEGSVRHGAAIECRRTKDAAEIVSRSISNYTSEYQWDLIERVYRWPTLDSVALFAVSKSVIKVAHADEEPPDPDRYWGLTCGSVRIP